MKLFDTHAHLDDERFDEDREVLIEKLKEENVSLVVNPGADMKTSRAAIKLAEKFDFIYAAVGIHPHDVKDIKEEDLIELEQMAKHEKVVAIGEIGLDYYYDNSPRELQREFFIKQIELANKVNLPIIIHSRDASMETYEILKEYKKDIGCVLHCFSQSMEMAELYLKLGCHLSFAGPLTFKKSHKLKEVARNMPLDKIFIETDAPYLTPEPFRGRRNDPAKVKYVAEELSNLRAISVDKIAEITMENDIKFFNISL